MSHIPFIRSAAPFDDVCIHVAERRDRNPRRTCAGRLGRWRGRGPAARRGPDVGGTFEALLGDAPHALALTVGDRVDVHIYTARVPAVRREGRVAYMEGMANHGEHALPEGPARERFLLQRPRLDPGDFALRGHFTAVVGDGDRLTVLADWLGMSQLYVAELDGEHVISNRMHLLRALVERHRGRASIVPEVLAQSVLLDTTWGCETLIEGVRLVPLDRHLTIDADGLHDRCHVDLPRIASTGSADDYGDLLRQAEREIRDNWRALCEGSQDRHRILYLTGGIDSRVALAAALAEDVPGLSYYTYGPQGCDDRRLAAELAQQVGLSRFPDKEPSLAGPFDAAVRWASLHYGQRTAALTAPRPTRDDRVRIRGATGETFRGFYSTMALERGCREGEVVDRAFITEHLLRKNVPWNLLPKRVAKDAERHLRSVIANEPLAQQTPCSIDALYPLYRNRHHFGLGLRTSCFEALQHAPLYSPSAVMASLLCDPMGRLQGKVAYDLIRRLAPELLAIETTSGPWHPSATRGWPPLRAEQLQPKRFSAPAGPIPSEPAPSPDGLALRDYRARLWREVPEVRDRVRDHRTRLSHFLRVERFATLCDRATDRRNARLARKCLNKGLLLIDVTQP